MIPEEEHELREALAKYFTFHNEFPDDLRDEYMLVRYIREDLRDAVRRLEDAQNDIDNQVEKLKEWT